MNLNGISYLIDHQMLNGIGQYTVLLYEHNKLDEYLNKINLILH